MIASSPTSLAVLAESDPSLAPLVRLHLAAQRAAEDEVWRAGLPDRVDVSAVQADEPRPALDGQTLRVDAKALRAWLGQLIGLLDEAGQPDAPKLRGALLGAPGRVNPLALVEASVALDDARLAALAEEANVDGALLTLLGLFAVALLLLAWGRQTLPALDTRGWQGGMCPACGAWPTLAELRGLDRERWLRCGRCGAAWRRIEGNCVFCGNDDYHTLAYLAREAELEAQRAGTCDACYSYLKEVATLGALSIAEVPAHDLRTLDLDAAALERGYGKPAEGSFPLHVQVEAVEKRRSWLSWRR